jgi:hypothetical protein
MPPSSKRSPDFRFWSQNFACILLSFICAHSSPLSSSLIWYSQYQHILASCCVCINLLFLSHMMTVVKIPALVHTDIF